MRASVVLALRRRLASATAAARWRLECVRWSHERITLYRLTGLTDWE